MMPVGQVWLFLMHIHINLQDYFGGVNNLCVISEQKCSVC